MRAGRVVVLGAGSWGTALATQARDCGAEVSVWARRPRLAEEIAAGSNDRYLPGVFLAVGIQATAELNQAVKDAGCVLLAVPCKAVAELCDALGNLLPADVPVVCTSKGLEQGTGRRMSEVMADRLKTTPASHQTVLLGPSHAEEVAERHPTAIVLSGGSDVVRTQLQQQLSGPYFRVYTNDDLVGVEIAAATKNILAIAAGICDGLGLGDNTKGALLTRGVAEIARLGEAMGGRRETFFGLSGIGDVITTCLSQHSRNRALGERVGKGEALDDAAREIGQVVEGVFTARVTVDLAQRYDVSMPIAAQVAQVLFEGKSPRRAIEDLMTRSLKSEDE